MHHMPTYPVPDAQCHDVYTNKPQCTLNLQVYIVRDVFNNSRIV